MKLVQTLKIATSTPRVTTPPTATLIDWVVSRLARSK
jgi:hypothetical protein